MSPHPGAGAAGSIAVVAHRKKISRTRVKALKAALRAAGHQQVAWRQVDKGKHATRAARQALKDGADVVVVCGGDGTVRAAAEALVGSPAALAVVPCGTANLFAGAMSIPDDPAGLVELIVGGMRRTIDTGTCNGKTFTVMAGTGLDAAMIDAADNAKKRFGTLAYVRAGVREARERTPVGVSVRVDGSLLFEGETSCVLIGNIGTLKEVSSRFRTPR